MAFGDKEFTLGTPESVVETQTAKYTLRSLLTDVGETEDLARVHILLIALTSGGAQAVDSQGRGKSVTITKQGADARSWIDWLNATDNSSTPLDQNVLGKLETDGDLPAGTIS